MNIIGYNEVNLFFYFSLLILSFQAALTIVYTKFGRNLRFDGFQCVADNIVFQAENVSTSLACTKICYNDMLCDVIFYQPDLLTCIGCAGTYHFAEVLPGSTYFARSSGKGHQGWIDHRNSYYYFSPDKKNLTDSSAACRKLGSDLAEVNDATENNFLVLNNNDARYWIGLIDKERNGTYVWMSFTFWSPGEPSYNYDHEVCALYYGKDHSYMWNNYNCSVEYHYICERTFPEF